MTVAQHPSAENLTAYGLGKLDDETHALVEGHMTTCADCRRQAAEATPDGFLGRLKDAVPPAVNGPEAFRLTDPTRSFQAAEGLEVPGELAGLSQYTNLRELGRGGMGVVYLARNAAMDREEVLKVVNKAVLKKAGAAERFEREIRAAAKLRHTNIVTAYAVVQVGDLTVFSMEYVPGDDLAKVLQKKGPLPVARACHCAYQTAQGLQHAHEKGMVHRDIKPSNLMLTPDGRKLVVKILDFGLAKSTRATAADRDLTGSGNMLGTPTYMAPEQVADAATADIRADVYALGCTLYCLLTGRPPFVDATPFAVMLAHKEQPPRPLDEIRPDVPKALAAVVGKMLAKDPNDRYQTPAEVAKALLPFVKNAAPVSQGAAETDVPRETDIAVAALASDSLKRIVPPRSNARRGRLGAFALTLVALAGLGGLAYLVGISIETKDGTIELTDLAEGVDVRIDGDHAKLTWGAGRQSAVIRIPPGTHELEVKYGDIVVVSDKVEIKSGKKRQFVATRKNPPKGEEAKTTKPGTKIPAQNRLATLGSKKPSDWAVEGDVLLKNASGPDTRIIFGDRTWKDYTFTFEAQKVDEPEKEGVGAIIRAADLQNRYDYYYGGYGGTWSDLAWYLDDRFHRGKTPAEGNELCRVVKPMVLGQWYAFEVSTLNDEITCRVNGIKYFTYKEDTVSRGCVGVKTDCSRYQFRKIKVAAPDGSVLWDGPPDLPKE